VLGRGGGRRRRNLRGEKGDAHKSWVKGLVNISPLLEPEKKAGFPLTAP